MQNQTTSKLKIGNFLCYNRETKKRFMVDGKTAKPDEAPESWLFAAVLYYFDKEIAKFTYKKHFILEAKGYRIPFAQNMVVEIPVKELI